MFRKTLALTILITTLTVALGAGYVRHFGSGPIMGTGTFVTTVSKQPYQNPASVYFTAMSYSMTSSNESLLEQTVNSGSSSNAMVGASSGTCQLLYCYSPSLDGTLSIYGNSYGTGSIISGGSVAITAGVPYEWDYLTSGTTAALALSSTNSVVFKAGTTVSGGTTSITSTSITAVGLFP